MVVLVMPEGCGFENEDVGCSWDALAYRQRAGFLGDLTKAAVEEGDTLAMQDRNCITEEFERKVFVHVVDDESAFIFDEYGEAIDEPSEFVSAGRQSLRGDHSFFEEWTDDGNGYYQLGVPPEGWQPDEAEAAAAPGAAPVPTPAPAAAVATAALVAKIMVEGQRVRECFKMSDDDTVGTWFGGLVVTMEDGACMVAYDDGDAARRDREHVQGLVEMGKMDVLDGGSGLSGGNPVREKACEMSRLKVKEMYWPVGVLVGDGEASLGGRPLFSSHYLVKELLEAASSAKGARPLRGGGGRAAEHGLATFRRGDVVTATGGGAVEVVYGVMSFHLRKQQHRYLITFDRTLEMFSVGAWTSWQRVIENSGEDPEDPTMQVEIASAEQLASMVAQWDASPLECSSPDAVHKMSQLGPAGERVAALAANKEKEKLRKATQRAGATAARKAAEKAAAEEAERQRAVAAAESARVAAMAGAAHGAAGAAHGSGRGAGGGGRGRGGGGHGSPAGMPAQPQVLSPSPPRSVKILKRKIRGLEEALKVEPSGERARELGELKEELDERKDSKKKHGRW